MATNEHLHRINVHQYIFSATFFIAMLLWNQVSAGKQSGYELLKSDSGFVTVDDSRPYPDELEQIYPFAIFPDLIHRPNPRNAHIFIENGMRVPSQEFETLFRKQRNRICTLVVVGPRVAITAAHCFSYRNTRVHFKPIEARGICRQHPGWPHSASSDIALCGFNKDVSVQRFEAISSHDKPQPGTTIVMMGYGCTRQGGPVLSRLRMGFGTVSNRPPNAASERDTIFVVSNSNNGEAALCDGDSGGPTFVFEGSNVGPRYLVGINSRVATVGSLRYSYISSASTSSARRFIVRWTNRYGYDVCGINLPGAKAPCRGF